MPKRTPKPKPFPYRARIDDGQTPSKGRPVVRKPVDKQPPLPTGDTAIQRAENRKAKQLEIAERRKQVAALIYEGLSYQEIADRLDYAPSTIRADYRAVLEELRDHRLALGELALDRQLADIEAFLTTFRPVPGQELNDRTAGLYLSALRERAKLLDLYPDRNPEISVQPVIVLSFSDDDHREDRMESNAPRISDGSIVEGSAVLVEREQPVRPNTYPKQRAPHPDDDALITFEEQDTYSE